MKLRRLKAALLAVALAIGTLLAVSFLTAPAANAYAGMDSPVIAGHDDPVPGDYFTTGYDSPAVVRYGSLLEWHILGHSTVYFGLPGDIPVPGDYCNYLIGIYSNASQCPGPNTTQIAIYRPSNNGWYVYTMSTGVTTFLGSFGLAGDYPVPGFYEYGGLSPSTQAIHAVDVAVFRPSTSTLYWLETVFDPNPGTAYAETFPGHAGVSTPPFYAVPAPIVRTIWGTASANTPIDATALQYWDNSGTVRYSCTVPGGGTQCKTGSFGLPGDEALAMDWGEHITTAPSYASTDLISLVNWRSSNGTWYFTADAQSGNFALLGTTQWGLPGDEPLLMDYDGPHVIVPAGGNIYADPVDNLATYRPCNGTWYIQGKQGAANTTIQYGLALGGC